MNKDCRDAATINFAKRCMETEWKVGLCDDLWCQTTCPYGISLAKGETVCSNSSRKAWAEKVLEEAETTSLYPPSTYIATPALAEPREEETYFGSGEIHLGDYEMETKQNAKCEQEKELPRFEDKTRGGYEYVIYKIYSEEEGVLPYLVHGAVKNDEGKWKNASWRLDGEFSGSYPDPRSLIPLKKRRMKTLNELGKDYDFHYVEGLITVYGDGMKYKAVYSSRPEYNFDEMDAAWKTIFTVEEEA
jgi:hypothetical protein